MRHELHIHTHPDDIICSWSGNNCSTRFHNETHFNVHLEVDCVYRHVNKARVVVSILERAFIRDIVYFTGFFGRALAILMSKLRSNAFCYSLKLIYVRSPQQRSRNLRAYIGKRVSKRS